MAALVERAVGTSTPDRGYHVHRHSVYNRGFVFSSFLQRTFRQIADLASSTRSTTRQVCAITGRRTRMSWCLAQVALTIVSVTCLRAPSVQKVGARFLGAQGREQSTGVLIRKLNSLLENGRARQKPGCFLVRTCSRAGSKCKRCGGAADSEGGAPTVRVAGWRLSLSQ